VDFEEFFAEHYGPTVRTLTLAFASQARAEDAAQEAFAKAYRRWSSVSAMDRPASWIYVVAVHQHRDWVRSDRRRAEREGRTIEEAWDPTGNLLTAVDIRTALESLAPRQRRAVVLRYLAGLTNVEVAEAMRCSVGTVKSTVHAGLRRLRVEIEVDDEA
jgi:RNA polymerase sigma-70 factor, ECF subfamily